MPPLTIKLSLPTLLTASGVALALTLVSLMAVFGGLMLVLLLLSGMFLKLWYIPLMLTLCMSTILAAVVLPVVGGLAWLLASLTQYQLSEDGLTQTVGPVSRHLPWLQITRYSVEQVFGLRLLKVYLTELDPPIVLYWDFLQNPDSVEAAWPALSEPTSLAHREWPNMLHQLQRIAPTRSGWKRWVPGVVLGWLDTAIHRLPIGH
ncbi:MAG: hypothetical protein QE263_08070 [Vampirovibrionales bacterium]|nr:hypothetical protein [Vampirovibrionales bacterium]